MKHWLTRLAVIPLALAPMAVPATAADATIPGVQVAALATVMPRSPLSQDSIYFVMTDRYANGDIRNDHGSAAVAGGLASGGFKPSDPGYFHGGDLKGLTRNLDRVKRLGFTAVWITPPFVNRAVQGSSAAYHGYWILDFTHIDPHFGTEADFDSFVAKAHALRLKVYVDIVMNHTADIIGYRDGTGFGAPGSKQPFVPAAWADVKSPAFLNDLSNYHNQGNVENWSSPQQYQNGDFYGLDDIKTENTAVVDGFADVYSDWLVNHAVDGFRIDTAKHVDDAFFARWIPKLMQDVQAKAAAKGLAAHQPQLFGEVFIEDPATLATYVRDRRLPSVLDFGLQPAVVRFAAGASDATALSGTLNYDDAFNAGVSSDGFVRNAYGLTVFGGNHDMGRTAMLVQNAGGGTTPAQLLPRTELAYSLLYLLRGAPVVYYGDEVGMLGTGGDKAAREDMFPTQVASWKTEARVGGKPIGSGSSLSRSEEKLPIALFLRALNGLRSKYAALRSGALTLRKAHGSLLVWSRIDAGERREFVVASNASNRSLRATVQTSTPDSAFVSVFGGKVRAATGASGQLGFTVPPRSTLVLRAARLLPSTSSAPMLTAAASFNVDYGAPLLTASGYAGSDPITVTFAARTCASCAWNALGSDDSAPYRLVLEDGAWSGGDYLDVVAITRTSDGRSSAGPVLHLTHADVTR